MVARKPVSRAAKPAVKKATPTRKGAAVKKTAPSAPKKRTMKRKAPLHAGVVPQIAQQDRAVANLSDLDSFIPEQRYADMYVDHKWGNVLVHDLYAHAHDNGFVVKNEGPTGCGKTLSIRAYCAANKIPFYQVSATMGATIEQLKGFPKQDPETGHWVWHDGPVTAFVKASHHRKVCLLLNEVNNYTEKFQAGLFPILGEERSLTLDDKDGSTLFATSNLLIVADMNPGYQGTRDLNYAFNNRFDLHITWDYDPKVESKLVQSKSLLDLARQIRKRTEQGDFDTPTSTNMLQRFETLALSVGMDLAVANFVNFYQDDERGTVKEILSNLVRGNIEQELGIAKPAKKEATPSRGGDADDDTFEVSFDLDVTCSKCGHQFDMGLSKCPACGQKN